MRTGRASMCRVAGCLLLIAAVPAAVSAWLGREARADARAGQVTVGVVRQWSRVLWVDARPAEAFAVAHWPDAVNLSPANWDSQIDGLMERWEPGRRIVVYCDDSACGSSEAVAGRLRQEYGLPEVHVVTAGWAGLVGEGEP